MENQLEDVEPKFSMNKAAYIAIPKVVCLYMPSSLDWFNSLKKLRVATKGSTSTFSRFFCSTFRAALFIANVSKTCRVGLDSQPKPIQAPG